MAFFFVFQTPLLYLFGASDNTIGYASTYISIYLVGTVFVELAVGLNTFISCQGHARTAMCSVLIGAVVNIGLDPVFHPEKLGIKNANYWVGERAEEIRDKERAKLNSGSRQDLEGNVLNVASGN